jgi:hypothetical protein
MSQHEVQRFTTVGKGKHKIKVKIVPNRRYPYAEFVPKEVVRDVVNKACDAINAAEFLEGSVTNVRKFNSRVEEFRSAMEEIGKKMYPKM